MSLAKSGLAISAPSERVSAPIAVSACDFSPILALLATVVVAVRTDSVEFPQSANCKSSSSSSCSSDTLDSKQTDRPEGGGHFRFGRITISRSGELNAAEREIDLER